jgi:hypothetical protein
VVLKQAEGKEKMEKERRRCSTADEALRVTPDPRRGDGSGGRALERTATVATTALTTRSHSALELSHAGSGAHNHIAAIICGRPANNWMARPRSLLSPLTSPEWLCWLCFEFPNLGPSGSMGYERALVLVVWFFGQWWCGRGGRTGVSIA